MLNFSSFRCFLAHGLTSLEGRKGHQARFARTLIDMELASQPPPFIEIQVCARTLIQQVILESFLLCHSLGFYPF